MLPKSRRVGNKSFETTLSHGERRFSEHFTVRTHRASGEEKGWRFGVVVSKKVAYKAVLRNSLRRKVKAAVLSVGTSQSRPASIVIFPKKEALHLSVHEIKQELEVLFKTSGLYKNSGNG